MTQARHPRGGQYHPYGVQVRNRGDEPDENAKDVWCFPTRDDAEDFIGDLRREFTGVEIRRLYLEHVVAVHYISPDQAREAVDVVERLSAKHGITGREKNDLFSACFAVGLRKLISDQIGEAADAEPAWEPLDEDPAWVSETRERTIEALEMVADYWFGLSEPRLKLEFENVWFDSGALDPDSGDDFSTVILAQATLLALIDAGIGENLSAAVACLEAAALLRDGWCPGDPVVRR